MISPLQKKSGIISPEELDKQIEHSKNQAISKKDCECEKEGQCSLANIIQEDFEEEEYGDIYLKELVHINNSINYFMINIKEEQIQSLIDRLEKLEIIGENVLKYWEKDKVECILKIKNPDYKIKTNKTETTEKDREDYKTHINDLLKLNVIRRSYSLHRLPVTPQTRGSVDYQSTRGIQVVVGSPDTTSENRAESPLYGELYPNTSPA